MFFSLHYSSSIAPGMDPRLLSRLCCIMAQLQLADDNVSACHDQPCQDLLGNFSDNCRATRNQAKEVPVVWRPRHGRDGKHFSHIGMLLCA
jgi:hypothetical protein